MPQLDSAIKPGYSHTSQSHMTIMSLLIQIIEKFWSIAFDQTGATAVTEPGSPNLRKSFRQVHIGSMPSTHKIFVQLYRHQVTPKILLH